MSAGTSSRCCGHRHSVARALAAALALVAASGPVRPAAAQSATGLQQDAAVAVQVRQTSVTVSGGEASEILDAQLVDSRGLPTDNGQLVARISWEVTGNGATLGAPPTGPSASGCTGPGVAGSGLTSPVTGSDYCQVTAPVGTAVTVHAFSAATAFESPQPVVGLDGADVVGVAAAAYDTYYLTGSGGVLAVGENPLGELGNGTTTSSPVPVDVHIPAGDQVSAVAGGGYFALALTETGSVLSWGQDFAGQLGDGALAPSALTPQSVRLPSSVRINEIAAGCNHALALTSTGAVLAWGQNLAGQLGDGGRALSDTPVAVHLPTGTVAVAIAAGCNTSYALTNHGTVYAWGSGAEGELGTGKLLRSSSVPVLTALGSGVAAASISAGNSDGYAVTTSGAVMAWGANTIGQAGTPGATYVLRPEQVSFPPGTAVASVVGGGFNAFAVTASHALYAWGGNYDGQDGVGSLQSLFRPTVVPIPGGAGIAALNGSSAGGFQAVALATDGSVLAWGGNFDEQLGYGINTTGYFSMGLAASGAAYAWGSGATGSYGTGASRTQSLVPVPALPGTTWSSVSAGCAHVLAISTAGVAYGWGSDADGQAGGSFQPGPVPPTAVPLPGNQRAEAVAAGCMDSLALAGDGRVYSWGADQSGQLGDGSTLSSASPVAVALPAKVSVKAIAAGCAFGMALTTTGSVYSWGDNSEGQLGHGTGPSTATPQLVAGIPPLTEIAAGCSHALGLAPNGALYAWGANSNGQLGTGTTAPSSIPVEVKLPGIAAVSIAAGGNQSFLITSAATCYGWGSNTTGQLGTGGFLDVLAPALVRSPSGVQVSAVATHGVSTLLLTAGAGRAYGVGGNLFGQLGDGTMLTTSTPLPVSGTVDFASASVGGYADWTYLYPTPLTGQNIAFTL